MKAEIKYNYLWKEYWWVIFYSNGAVAVEGPCYTRKDNAKRGLKKFCENLSSYALQHLAINSDKDLGI